MLLPLLPAACGGDSSAVAAQLQALTCRTETLMLSSFFISRFEFWVPSLTQMASVTSVEVGTGNAITGHVTCIILRFHRGKFLKSIREQTRMFGTEATGRHYPSVRHWAFVCWIVSSKRLRAHYLREKVRQTAELAHFIYDLCVTLVELLQPRERIEQACKCKDIQTWNSFCPTEKQEHIGFACSKQHVSSCRYANDSAFAALRRDRSARALQLLFCWHCLHTCRLAKCVCYWLSGGGMGSTQCRWQSRRRADWSH